MNEEFQRITRRDKKVFLCGQCNRIEEKQQDGKDQRFLQENWKYKGIFHAKMGTIKDRSDKELTEAEEIKKRQKSMKK